MKQYQDVVEAGLPTTELLKLCKRLERAWSLDDVLGAVAPVARDLLGYPHVWLALVSANAGMLRLLSHRSGGEHSEFSQAIEEMEIPVAGDAMLAEIMSADKVVVVEDARTDPRTNKAIVAQLHNRTIINVPLLLADQRLGALGMGTYGDAEGVRAPLPWQLDFMQAMATHFAVSLDRVRFLQERKATEAALYQEKERLQVTLHSISDAVITTNAGGELLYLNPMAEQLTGWSLDAAVARHYGEVFSVQPHPVAGVPLDVVCEALEAGQTHRYPQLELCQRLGGRLTAETAVSPIRDADGEVQGAVLVFRDVTEQRRLSQEIEFQATHDELTGLGNRRAFERVLRASLDSAQAAPQPLSHVLCYLDLDEFKVVNDTCGHSAGDELLRQVAHLFADMLREQDHLCRIGGDEFGMVLTHQSVDTALQVAQRLQLSLAAYRFLWRHQSFSVGVSIGMVVIDASSDSVGALMQAADNACYVAKEEGRSRIHVWASDDPAVARRFGVMEWVSRLEHALTHDRFELHAQTLAPLGATEPGLHCEILVRLRDETGRLVLPGEFMPAAERYRLVSRLDRWVVRHALRWVAQNAASLAQCAINLSGQSLGDATFVSFVLDALAASGAPCDKLCFEVTETAAIGNMHTAQTFIATLHQLGCKVALDDFGSGLSSFAYLRNLPVDVLKIDGQFVKDIAHDPVSLAMVRSIHEIACLMGKRTVAEFVESEAILAQLRTIGVHYAQGYAISRPVPLGSVLPGL